MDNTMEEIAKQWLKKKIAAFVGQFNPNEPHDKIWTTDEYRNNKDVLENFYNFVEKESREKEHRRKLYEELKKEFE